MSNFSKSILSFLLIFGIYNLAFSQSESFKNASAAGWTFGPDTELTGDGIIDPVGDGWLRLNDLERREVGYAILDAPFSSTTGIILELAVNIWGSGSLADGYIAPFTDSPADGLAVYLFDGSVAVDPGVVGPGLGYSGYNLNAITTDDGAAGGFIGVGIDEWGNFSNSAWPIASGANPGPGGPGFRKDAIAIRGGESTKDVTGTTAQPFRYLNGTAAGMVDIFGSYTDLDVSIDPSSRPADFHQIRVTLDPGAVGGVRVKLELDHLNTGTYLTIVDQTYPTSVLGAVPSTLKIGLSSSTGSATAYHEVRDLKIIFGTLSIDLDSTDGNFDLDYNTTFTCGSGAINITSANVEIKDNFDPDIDEIQVTLSNPQVGDDEGLFVDVTALASIGSGAVSLVSTYNPVTGEDLLRFTGVTSVDDYEQVLELIEYNNTSPSPSSIARIINIDAKESIRTSNTAVATIAIAATDTDGDSVCDGIDLDIDNDGIPNADEGTGDTDGDGIPDAFDLDSDNDGIPDVIEAGGDDPDGDGRVGAGIPADVDMDGIADVVDNVDNGSGAGEVTSGTPLSLPSSDGDASPDYQDIDADNDGIVDNIEAQTSAGYIAPSGVDTDMDGLDDAYDIDCAPCGAVTGAPINPVNTDTSGSPDYQDDNADDDSQSDLIEGWDTDNDGVANTSPSGNDSDGDGLDDAFDSDGTGATDNGGPTNNGTTPTDFPNLDDANAELDWRDPFDTDGDGIPDKDDLDIDNDGIPNADEGTGDTDGDGIPDAFDLDTDNDGIPDVIEAGGDDPDGDGRIGTGIPADLDMDGIADSVDNVDNGSGGGEVTSGTPLSPPSSDGDASPDYQDIDADNDGIVDNIEAQTSAGYTAPSGVDTDMDGLDDAYDIDCAPCGAVTGVPINPANTDSTDSPDYQDDNADDDSQSDLIEGWDTDNDGVANTSPSGNDSDGDGLDDAFDNDGTGVTDNGGSTNNGTTPTDFPNLDDANAELDWRDPFDTDGDGIPDKDDLDIDNDGIPNADEGTGDTDGDGIPDAFDLDSDNDGIPDVIEASGDDPDGDGRIGTGIPADVDMDGIADSVDNVDNGSGAGEVTSGTPLSPPSSGGDASPDYQDIDADNDGIVDNIEAQTSAGYIAPSGVDTDMDGLDDAYDIDCAPCGAVTGAAISPINTDNLDNPDYQDIDSDNDGIIDNIEALSSAGYTAPTGVDTDMDGLDDAYDVDCAPCGAVLGTAINPVNTDGSGNPDYQDIDADGDGIVDNIEGQSSASYIAPSGVDTDMDGLDDAYDVDCAPCGAVTGVPINPINTDNADMPDYKDGNADNDQHDDLIEGWDTDNDGVADTTPSGNDSDGDGLDDAFDSDGTGAVDNGGATNNGTLPTDFPNLDDPDAELDWREGTDTDGDGVPDAIDLDIDNDGIPNADEGTGDTDGDGIPDAFDLDSDNDGIPDIIEAGGNDPDGDGRIGFGFPADIDMDGLADVIDNVDNGSGGGEVTDGTPLNPPSSDGDASPDYQDIDADGDGIVDNIEAQSSAGYIVPSGMDTDMDGLDDAYDIDCAPCGAVNGSPINNPINTDGIDSPDYQDGNSDDDGQSDLIEGWDTDNDGIADTSPSGNDSDGDGLDDAFDSDGTGAVDNGGPTNNGTVPTDFPDLDDVNAELDWRDPFDTDGDGVPDNLDLDSDNDGIPDIVEGDGDTDGDDIPDRFDLDSDGDGVSDVIEAGGDDPDGDGIIGTGPITDVDGDGLADIVDNIDNGSGAGEVSNGTPLPDIDTDNDGTPNFQDVDDDGDGILTVDEDINNDGNPLNDDTDGDGIPNYLDVDDDGDSIVTVDEDLDNDGNPDNDDTDGDGTPNYLDDDDDNDGVDTIDEDANGDGNFNNDDCDQDSVPDYLDADGCQLFPTLGFSPNGDNNNDVWIIQGIESFPNNKVIVYNRWGNLVFEVEGYNNKDKAWAGQSNGRLHLGKSTVPDGTYFYLIDLGDNSKPLSGYVVLKR